MDCEASRPLLEAYVDGELQNIETLKGIEAHLGTCHDCSRSYQRLLALQKVIETEAPRYVASDALRKRIQGELRRSSKPAPAARNRFFAWTWAAVAASVCLVALGFWQIGLYRQARTGDILAKEIVSSHVRSMMAQHLVDEPSSDQHAVKPWFAGKLDFSPLVKNLDAQGFILAGGRLDYLDNRPVAAVVYRRRQHVINLFIWPSSSSSDPQSLSINGFNAVSWKADGMRYWAISDLNKPELRLFSSLVAETAK